MKAATLPEQSQSASFNCIIEGSFFSSWYWFHFKLTRLDILKNASKLKDNSFVYRFYDPDPSLKYSGGLEISIQNAASREGLVLPFDTKRGLSGFLERPRAIIFRDGGIYVCEKILQNKAYISKMDSILQFAGDIFNYITKSWMSFTGNIFSH